MSDIDIQRLRNDPAYWDEVAPEGATHAAPSKHHQGVLWFLTNVDDLWEASYGVGDDWDVQALQPPAVPLIPRPSQPQWRGPEDGLPPVGTVCEVKPAQGAGWCSGTVVHVTAKGVALYEDRWGDFGHSMAPADFRPLKSDKERAVEAAMKVMPYPGSLSTRTDLECAYDAGLLRLPEEQS